MTNIGSNQRRAAPLLAIGGCAVVMAGWTWGTWLDVFVDSGRELYLAWQVAEGRQLYADVASFNGPLSPYVNAFWFHLFGVGVRSLVIGNLTLLALFLPLLYSTLRIAATRLSATVATIVFVSVFAFGEYDVGAFNYVLPYSHELVHGLFAAILALRAFAWFLDTRSNAAAIAVGGAVGVTMLTKPELALATLLALGMGMGLAALLRGRGLAVLLALIAALVPPAVAWLLLSRALGPAAAADALLEPFKNLFAGRVSSLAFYRNLTGLAAPWLSLRLLLGAAAIYAAVFGVATALSFAVRLRRRRHEAATLVSALLFGLGLAGFRSVVTGVARPLPLFMLAAALLLATRLFAVRDDDRRATATIFRLTLVVFSGALLAKVALNAHVYGYGFVLAMPASLLVVLALVEWIPATISARHADGVFFRTIACAALATVTVIFLGAHKERIDAFHFPVASGADRFVADSRAVPMQAMMGEVNRRLQPGDRLLVVPEGIMLNYLTRRRSPSPYPTFLPPEYAIFGEGPLESSVRGDAPEYIVLVDRPMREYGDTAFGERYGRGLAAWIRQHYEPLIEIPGAVNAAGRFGMRLLRRADVQP